MVTTGAKSRRGVASPAPPALKLLEGRGNGRDSGGRLVKPDPGFRRLPPEPPDFLAGEALDLWHRTVPELQRLQLTKHVDAPALAAYCLAWQRLVQAQRLLDEEGLMQSGPQGRTRHPAVMVAEAASKELRAWCAEFGLTPSAENRVGRQPEGGDGGEQNPFAAQSG